MYVEVKSSNGVTLVPMETVHLSKRRIFIQGTITMETACAFADQVMLLNDRSTAEAIDVIITSVGGEVQAGLMMYDVVQTSAAPIRMFCRGMAYSMAAVLFASGNHGRYILPNSKLMLHEPLLGNAVRGNVSSIRALSEELTDIRNQLNHLLSKHTGRSMEQIETACAYDHYFTPQECVDFGLADEVAGLDKLIGGM